MLKVKIKEDLFSYYYTHKCFRQSVVVARLGVRIQNIILLTNSEVSIKLEEFNRVSVSLIGFGFLSNRPRNRFIIKLSKVSLVVRYLKENSDRVGSS